MFSKFTSGLKTKKWINRNFHLYLLLKRITIATVCGFLHDFYYVVLALQVIHLFYIFVKRPYEFAFYNNIGILVQSLVVLLYFYAFDSDLYFKVSVETYSHEILHTHNLVRTIFFSIIFLILLFANLYETYEIIVKVKIQ